ncbi:MAG: hypothetical protein Q8P15_03500 [Nanoarchaeota archaeon]|nr:hypothetical protein [Nanoarchaeota archaeon]
MGERNNRLRKSERILNKRYYECDSSGHQEPDTENNICNYCYRRLEYISSINTTESQQESDYKTGLDKVLEELHLK